MILHLIRHPKPLIESGICYGQLDIPAENPAPHVARLRQQLPADIPVWSSPLLRCRALAEALHSEPQYDERLMEMNFGHWEGRPWDELPRSALDAWAVDLMGFAPPGGESAAQVQARLLAFLRENPSDEMIWVTHAGVIRLLLALQAQRPLSDYLSCPLPFAAVHQIAFPGTAS